MDVLKAKKKTASEKKKGDKIYSVINDDALDYAVVHLLRMLGLALDPLFAEAMAQSSAAHWSKVDQRLTAPSTVQTPT